MNHNDGIKTAILVDGGFYRRRAYACLGDLTPKERADELDVYCKRHLTERINGEKVNHSLYRIFYYDCEPVDKTIYNPFTKSNVNLAKSPTYEWTNAFFEELKKKRKFAIRLGQLAVQQANYNLSQKAFKKLCNDTLNFSDLSESDIILNIDQKGVDMKIGLDIASLSYKHQVDQIILISGDSDFVSASKLARREGIDFILDPLGATIKPALFEHIDGLRSCDKNFYNSASSKKNKVDISKTNKQI